MNSDSLRPINSFSKVWRDYRPQEKPIKMDWSRSI